MASGWLMMIAYKIPLLLFFVVGLVLAFTKRPLAPRAITFMLAGLGAGLLGELIGIVRAVLIMVMVRSLDASVIQVVTIGFGLIELILLLAALSLLLAGGLMGRGERQA